MVLKEIFHVNHLFHKIKLDDSEMKDSSYLEENSIVKEDREEEIFQRNEWHQEYELIYLSYVLER